MGLETQAHDIARREVDEPAPPAFGQRSGGFIDRVRVVTESLVKCGVLPDRIQPFRAIRILRCDQVHLDRHRDLVWYIRELAVQRLAADDDELLFAGYLCGSAEYVLNVLLLH